MKNRYEVRGDVTVIFIEHDNCTHEMLIDTDMLPLADSMPNTWFLNDLGYTRANYPANRKNRKSIKFHRFLTNAPKGLDVDHINGNKLDNRMENLRIVTRAQNLQNLKTRIGTKSGVRGVSWFDRDSKWRAYITLDKKQKHLGYFDTKEEAVTAAKEARKKHYPYANEGR